MGWRLKVARLALLNHIPFGEGLRRLKRQWLGYEPDPRNLRGTLHDLERMKAALQAIGRSFVGARVLEIGSGWFPTIPITLALGGARQVMLSDLTPHMDTITFDATLRFLRQAAPDDARLSGIRRFEDLPLTYLAPFDVAAIPDGSIDVVTSRTVLEHIPPDDLSSLLRALHPKLAPDGLMVHLIDNSDHLEHGDKSISKINFLTWSSRKHAAVNALIKMGENRLRHHQYAPLFEAAGYRIVSAAADIHEPTRAAAASLRLVAPFDRMSPEQLAVMTSLYVLARA